ncbi:TPA: transposase [Escherichia coli]
MKSLTAVRKKSPNYPVEFKIKMVELSHRPEISVAQLAREHGINDNLLFKWRQYWREGKLRPPSRQYWREGKLRPPSTTENNVPELLPITLDAEDVVPATSPRSQPVAAAAPESLNISCEVTFRHGSLRLNGAISENILNLLIRELKR